MTLLDHWYGLHLNYTCNLWWLSLCRPLIRAPFTLQQNLTILTTKSAHTCIHLRTLKLRTKIHVYPSLRVRSKIFFHSSRYASRVFQAILLRYSLSFVLSSCPFSLIKKGTFVIRWRPKYIYSPCYSKSGCSDAQHSSELVAAMQL